MDWLALLGPSIGPSIVALWALLRTMNREHGDVTLRPIIDRLDHLDTCLDAHEKATESFRKEVREEFKLASENVTSLTRQITGIQVGVAERYASKDDLERRTAELRADINVAGRVTALGERIGRH